LYFVQNFKNNVLIQLIIAASWNHSHLQFSLELGFQERTNQLICHNQLAFTKAGECIDQSTKSQTSQLAISLGIVSNPDEYAND